jgi:GH15 family glucan-1,4-alpha-glucosidase
VGTNDVPPRGGNLPVPPEPPSTGPLRGQAATRPGTSLPAGLIGNGSLLATIGARGELLRLWWPHPDRGQHLGELRIGLELDGEVRWLDEEPFEWTQSYVDDSTILRTTARSREVTVEIDDVVLPDEPVLLRRISSPINVGVVVSCRPELDERLRGMGAYVHGSTGAVVFHRTPYALALAVSRGAGASCGGFGRVHGTLHVELDGCCELAVALAETPAEAAQAAAVAVATSFEQHAEARRRVDAGRITAAAPPDDDADAPLYRRSLLVFDTLADAETGAVIAAPELDQDFVDSGGYGFVWPRDLAFLLLAFLASGRRDLAERALLWLPTAQEESGVWLQRHWTDGTLAPTWCEQLDETGSVLFAYEAAWRRLGDEALDEELWPSARRAADYLLTTIADQGIPCATADLWEERDGCHAYTAAATAAGLDAAASFAQRHDPGSEATYASAAERLRGALDRCFWSDEHGRYLRTLGDPVVDASLLGLAWPFRAVDPSGARMRATADAVERALARPGGGLLRYEGDTYAGGNPWVLAALWLGLYRRQIGDAAGHRRAVAYARRVATPLGLLPEQVTDDGEPAWVVPLAWSHAMYVLAARPELEVVRPLGRAAAVPLAIEP